MAWFRDLPVLRFPVVKSSRRGATHPRSRRRRFHATTERFTAITRTNHRGDEMAFAFRQQCFNAVVEEEALRDPYEGLSFFRAR
jgi:hypothetical protein